MTPTNSHADHYPDIDELDRAISAALNMHPSAEGLPALPLIVAERSPPAYLM